MNDTKKEQIQQLIIQLKELVSQEKEKNELETKIGELENKVDELKDSEADEIKNHINDVINNIPKGWADEAVNVSAIITPLILISKIAYDFFWDKLKTPQNLDDMLKQIKSNLQSDKDKNKKNVV